MPNKEKISADVFLTEINSLTCMLSITKCCMLMSNAMIENKKKYSKHKFIIKCLYHQCFSLLHGIDHRILDSYIDTEPNTNFVSHDFDSIKHIDI